ncbi:Rgp1-domain-containing protein [Phlegmacium glaucopus]|nr:Rgp1-domain-containing protein [Phlegmacium glaucopus]
MANLTSGDNDSPVRVVVTPSQSSYFAGEPFSVIITFTNTRSPEAGPSKPNTPTHKRGAHSISSAPLARPPTSPGTPRSAIAQSLSKTQALTDVPRPRGLVGKKKPPSLPLQSAGELPDLIEQRRRRQLAPKAVSVSLSPREVENEVGEGVIASSALYTQRSVFRDTLHTPTSPLVPSPLARTDSLPLASNHPHARKQSVLDGQFSLDILSPTTSNPPAPYSPSSSSSSFSLALDPIAEGALSPYSSTPAIGSPTIEHLVLPSHTPTLSTSSPANNSVYAYPPPRNPHHRPANLGLGQPPSSPRGYPHHIPRTAFATTFPQHQSNELILYSYAQLTGTVTITQVSGALSTPEQTHTLNVVRSALLKRSSRGGGSMDITSTLHSPLSPMPSKSPRHRTATHSRASSFSTAGLLSILSPTSLVSSISSPVPGSATSWTGSGWKSSSSTSGSSASVKFAGSASSPSVLGLGFPDGTGDEEVDPEEPLPTFEVQPAMLAVDLSLAPGESRSYTYTIKLPDNLPPTFKGKSLRFSYELVVGICRAGSSGGGGISANSLSRVMKVPIRMYNHVVVGRALAPYDLLWPISRSDAGTPDIVAKVVEEVRGTQKNHLSIASVTSPKPSLLTDDTLESLRSYAASLVATLPKAKDNSRADTPLSHVQTSDDTDSPSANRTGGNARNGKYKASAEPEKLWRIERDREPADAGGLTGCREAVELLTRNPRKVSYDVNKDGVKVAVLTFTKTAYRLGETVLGVVEVNERASRARVLKLSAILESHESLPSSISPTSSARHLRRSHAEHHSSFTLNTLRTTFSLDIPSDASPAFQVGVGSAIPNSANPSAPSPPHPTSGGLEWKVRLCLLVGIAAETSYTGIQDVRFKSLVRDGPRGEWGSSWGATAGISPLEKPNPKSVTAAQRQQQGQFQITSPRAWSQFLVSSILYGSANPGAEREYHDGDAIGDEDEDDDNHGSSGSGDKDYDGIIPDLAGGVGVGVDYANGDDGWQEVKLEMVECEVPVRVFPGNTAFKALDVIFDV